MASAFAESTLAQIYKERHGDGSFRGGPVDYIQKGLGSRGWGVAFAIALVAAFGLVFNAVQTNSIADVLVTAQCIGDRHHPVCGFARAAADVRCVCGHRHHLHLPRPSSLCSLACTCPAAR